MTVPGRSRAIGRRGRSRIGSTCRHRLPPQTDQPPLVGLFAGGGEILR